VSWAKRGNNTYYYRSVRRGRRVTSEYFGGGLPALAAAMADEERAAERAARVAAHAANRRLAESVEQSAARPAELAGALRDAWLLLSGYHKDCDRIWRRIQGRKRIVRKDSEDLEANASSADRALSREDPGRTVSTAHALAAAIQAGISPDRLTSFLALVQRVDHGAPAAGDLIDLERALAEQPGIWRLLADYGRQAIDAMIDQLEPSPSLRLAFTRGADELRAGLAAGSALEAAVAEQISVCWVRLRIYEFWLARATTQDDEALIRFWEERVGAAQRRFLAACHELAAIRQLAARNPALLQINVAGQQVSVAAAGKDPAPGAGPSSA
jgi:hypothetical protein